MAQKIQDRFYPLPNFGDTSVFASQNYRENVTRGWDAPIMLVTRGDHRFSDRDFVYARFTFTRAPNTPFEGNLPAIGRRIQRRDTRSLTGSYTHTIKSNLVNEFRYGMILNNNPVAGPINGLDMVKDLGLVGLAPDLPNVSGLLKVNWSGLGLQPIAQADYTNPGFRNHGEQFQDHLSWFIGPPQHQGRLRSQSSRVGRLSGRRRAVRQPYLLEPVHEQADLHPGGSQHGLWSRIRGLPAGPADHRRARVPAHPARPQSVAVLRLYPGRLQNQPEADAELRRAV